MNLKKKIDVLFAKISVLESEVSTLKKGNIKLSQGLKYVTGENVKLRKENTQLKEKVITLEVKLHKKNSSNSSMPPSKDENRVKPNQSLREKTGKKSGGQIGHPGSTLKMYTIVDKVVNHKENYCSFCSAQLVGEQHQVGRRQVVDIPPLQPIITEHRIYSTVCTCGERNTTCYPKEASASISYGNSVEAAIGYLSVGQYMSMQRIAELIEQVFNIRLSQGTVSNMLASLTRKCIPMYSEIKSRIASSPIVGTDETGCAVNGKKWWMWTWQNTKLTYIAASNSRGYQAILDNF